MFSSKACLDVEDDVIVSEDVTIVDSFKKMGLKNELLLGIYEYGFERPSLVQQRAIKPIISGRDVVVQAQSGSGKTATFCIGILQLVNAHLNETQAVILAPTRELAAQIYQVMIGLGGYLSLKCVLCCGGRSDVSDMTRRLTAGRHVVVGTPGRILDLLRHGCLRFRHLRVFVLDEADEILNQGLRDQLEEICKRLPSEAEPEDLPPGQPRSAALQHVVVSATWTAGCREVMKSFLAEPLQVLVPRAELSLSGISQYYIDVGAEEWKFETLMDIFASICVAQTVVFANTRRKVEWLAGRLRGEGFAVSHAHGDMDQAVRDTTMQQFRAGRSRVLVTTDIWARGIDVQAVSLVLNYDLPLTAAVYLHRIGRSGRFGRRGLALSLVGGLPTDRAQLASFARRFCIAIEAAPAPLDSIFESRPPAVASAASSSNPPPLSDPPAGSQEVAEPHSSRPNKRRRLRKCGTPKECLPTARDDQQVTEKMLLKTGHLGKAKKRIKL